MSCLISVSIGELADKVTILQIKQERIADPAKLANITHELATITPILATFSVNDNLMMQLKTVNENLWEIEDEIRVKERKKEFDEEFITLARAVYITNDERFEIKREINTRYNSDIHEVKSYNPYV